MDDDKLFEHDWMKYPDGQVGLIFAPPASAAACFEGFGDGGSGHDWRRVLESLLLRVAPQALRGTSFDCEADLFVAINQERKALETIVSVMRSLLADQQALRGAVRAAFGYA